MAGVVCLWFDLLRPDTCNMPGYEADYSPDRYSFEGSNPTLGVHSTAAPEGAMKTP